MLGIIGSFNPKFYKKVVKQPIIKSLCFLFFFIILISSILSFKHEKFIKGELPEIISWTHRQFEYIIYDFPLIEIRNGVIIYPTTSYIKKWNDDFIFIIEPEEDNFYPILQKYPNVLVLVQRGLAIKITRSGFERSQIKTYDLKRIKFLQIIPTAVGIKVSIENRSFNITPPLIRKFFRKILSSYLYPIILLGSFLFFFFTKPLQILIFSLVALTVNVLLKTPLKFKHLLNIGIYALVPPTVLAIIKDFFGLEIFSFGAIYYLTYLIYLLLGMRSAKESIRQESISQEEKWQKSG